MSLTVNLKINSSPVEKIGKSLTDGVSFNCLLKDNCSVLRPTIEVVTSENITGYNYMQIPDFSRYYFIDDIISLNNNKWRISGHVDTLETYAAEILENSAIIEGTENIQRNNYLNDNVFMVNCKHKTDIINFPYGLLDSGQFILITAGG